MANKFHFPLTNLTFEYDYKIETNKELKSFVESGTTGTAVIGGECYHAMLSLEKLGLGDLAKIAGMLALTPTGIGGALVVGANVGRFVEKIGGKKKLQDGTIDLTEKEEGKSFITGEGSKSDPKIVKMLRSLGDIMTSGGQVADDIIEGILGTMSLVGLGGMTKLRSLNSFYLTMEEVNYAMELLDSTKKSESVDLYVVQSDVYSKKYMKEAKKAWKQSIDERYKGIKKSKMRQS